MTNPAGAAENKQNILEEQGYTLYASPDARAHYGWVADALPGWAGQDVLIVTPQDILQARTMMVGPNIFGPPEENSEMGFFELLGGQYFMEHAIRLGAPPFATPEGLTLESPYNTTEVAGAIQYAAMNNSPAATRMDFTDNASGAPYSLCVIVGFDENMTGAEIASRLSATHIFEGAPVLPGTAHDWNMMVMAHEADHCDRMDFELMSVQGEAETLRLEIHADQTAMNRYRAAEAEGLVDTPGLTQVFNEMRALGTVISMDTTHTTTTAVDPHNDALLQDPDGYGSSYGFLEYGDDESMPVDPIHHEDVVGFFNQLHDYLRYEAELHNLDDIEIHRLLISDPELMYETVSLMHRRGDFAEHHIHDDIAARFVAAADNHAADLFGTRAPGPDPVQRISELAAARMAEQQQPPYDNDPGTVRAPGPGMP